MMRYTGLTTKRSRRRLKLRYSSDYAQRTLDQLKVRDSVKEVPEKVLQQQGDIKLLSRYQRVRKSMHVLNNSFNNVLNDRRVRRALSISSIIATHVAPFMEKPTFWNGLKSVGVGMKALADDATIWPDDFFAGDEWICPYDRGFINMIHETLNHLPKQVLVTGDENEQIHLFDIEGIKAGLTYNTQTKCVSRIFVDTKFEKEAKQNIKDLIWKKYGDRPLVMSKNVSPATLSGNSGDHIVMEHDNSRPPLNSEFATNYTNYLKRALDQNINRSVLLYGPPGTGKSTIARTIVNNLGLRSFRIRVEDLSSFGNTLLFDAIDIFNPEAIILDDFDRCGNQSQLLETLDYFQRNVKIVLATVNDPTQLDEALRRPERFDELVYIDKMDETVIRHMLGEYIDAYDIVKDWPITFINEYIKRRKFMTADEANLAVRELATRVSRLSRYKMLNDSEIVAGDAEEDEDKDETEEKKKDDKDALKDDAFENFEP